MTSRHHFAFERTRFDEGRAHGGSRPIRFTRVRERPDGFSGNFIDLVIVPPGADIGLHTHATDNEEIYVVIGGVGRMQLEGDVIEVALGHVIINRPGGTHGLVNTGTDDLRLVVIEIPR